MSLSAFLPGSGGSSAAAAATAAAAAAGGADPPALPSTRPRALCLYVFDRAGTALHYAEWHRPKPVSAGAGSPADDAKMMFGLLFSLRTLAAAVDPLSPTKQQLGAPLRIGDGCSFRSFTTNNYKLHALESPSGLKIVLLTDPGVGDLGDHLAHLYAAVWVEYASRNPARAVVGAVPGGGGEGRAGPGEAAAGSGGLQSAGPLFAAKLDAYLASIGLL